MPAVALLRRTVRVLRIPEIAAGGACMLLRFQELSRCRRSLGRADSKPSDLVLPNPTRRLTGRFSLSFVFNEVRARSGRQIALNSAQ